MDALSRVLELSDVKGAPDLRCLLSGQFAIPHDPVPAGEAMGGQFFPLLGP